MLRQFIRCLRIRLLFTNKVLNTPRKYLCLLLEFWKFWISFAIFSFKLNFLKWNHTLQALFFIIYITKKIFSFMNKTSGKSSTQILIKLSGFDSWSKKSAYLRVRAHKFKRTFICIFANDFQRHFSILMPF